MTYQLPLNHREMSTCQINPPNILCALWNQPSLIVKYFQRKALEGNREEGECKLATVTLSKPPANFDTYIISGFGTIVIPREIEITVTEKEKTTSFTQTCESTPEQPRGYAVRLAQDEEEESESQEEDGPSSKAIAQTLALISSGHKYSVDEATYHMALFRNLKRRLVPGRRFTLF